MTHIPTRPSYNAVAAHGDTDPLTDKPRDRAKLLIAQQMLVNNGYVVWNRIDARAKIRYLTFAETALATVERIADKISWERFGDA